MRILLVSTNFNRYQGRERYTLELVKQFIKEHEVHLLTANYDYKPIPNLIVHKKPIIKKPFWLQLLTTYYFNTKWVQRIKKEFNIDLIHSSESSFCDVMVAHSCYRGVIKEANRISKEEFFYPKYLLYKIRRWLLPKNRAILMLQRRDFESRDRKIIAVSKGVKKEILENYNIPEEKITVIPIGINPEEFEPNSPKRLEIRRKYNISEDDILLIFCGYEFKRKGLEYIIKALPLVKGNVKLVVVGKDNTKPYKRLAISLGVLDKIVFTGFVPEIKDYYTASDIFVFPTFYEAFSQVMLEAAASGLPILITKVYGAEELITDGINGFFIERNPEDIASKINLLMQNENLRKQIGNNARETAKKYSWEKVAKRTLEVCQEVLEMKKF